MNAGLQKFFHKLSLIGVGKERDFFMENFANLLLSGMSLIDSIEYVANEIKNPTLKKIMKAMAEDVRSGFALADAMERTEIFSAHVMSLVRIGQTSGRLNENIQIIVSEQKKTQEMNGKIRSALMYPGFVLVLVMVVGIGIAWFILPKLAKVFDGLNLQIPTITRYLINFGQFLQHYGVIAVPLFFAFLGVCFYGCFIHPKTRFIGEAFLFHCPGLKRVMKEAELGKFGFLLGTLLAAGLSVIQCFESLSKSTSTLRYKKLYEYLLSNLGDGFSFKQSFNSYPNIEILIPSSIQQIVIAGEQSGMLSETLLKLGDSYERRIEQTTKDLSVMLEPIMLVVVWAGVVGLALSVILPIYSLIGGVK